MREQGLSLRAFIERRIGKQDGPLALAGRIGPAFVEKRTATQCK